MGGLGLVVAQDELVLRELYNSKEALLPSLEQATALSLAVEEPGGGERDGVAQCSERNSLWLGVDMGWIYHWASLANAGMIILNFSTTMWFI